MTARKHCFTFWCKSKPKFNEKEITYLVFQREITPTTKKEHWQGYVEWKKPRRGTATDAKVLFVKDYMKTGKCADGKTRSHMDGKFEKAFGTAEENKKYCSKSRTSIEGSFEEYGKPGYQGARTDIKTAMKTLVEHKGSTEGWKKLDMYIVVQYGAAMQRAMKLMGVKEEKRANIAPKVKVYYSEKSGVGKTKKAVNELKNKDYYRVFNNRENGQPWWAGYNGEKIVMIDEYEPNMIPTNQLFQIFQHGECRVKTYGDEKQLLATEFVITSNFHPKDWVTDTKRHAAWMRRVKEFFTIIEM